MTKLIIGNGTKITLESYTQDDFIVACTDRAAFCAIWELMTPENLEEVQIECDGEIILSMENITVAGAQAVINGDGTISGHFYYRGFYKESDYARAGRILLGEEE